MVSRIARVCMRRADAVNRCTVLLASCSALAVSAEEVELQAGMLFSIMSSCAIRLVSPIYFKPVLYTASSTAIAVLLTVLFSPISMLWGAGSLSTPESAEWAKEHAMRTSSRQEDPLDHDLSDRANLLFRAMDKVYTQSVFVARIVLLAPSIAYAYIDLDRRAECCICVYHRR